MAAAELCGGGGVFGNTRSTSVHGAGNVEETVKCALLSPFCRRSERRRYFRAYVSVVDKKSDPPVGVMIATATRQKAKDHNPVLTSADDSSIFIKNFNDMRRPVYISDDKIMSAAPIVRTLRLIFIQPIICSLLEPQSLSRRLLRDRTGLKQPIHGTHTADGLTS